MGEWLRTSPGPGTFHYRGPPFPLQAEKNLDDKGSSSDSLGLHFGEGSPGCDVPLQHTGLRKADGRGTRRPPSSNHCILGRRCAIADRLCHLTGLVLADQSCHDLESKIDCGSCALGRHDVAADDGRHGGNFRQIAGHRKVRRVRRWQASLRRDSAASHAAVSENARTWHALRHTTTDMHTKTTSRRSIPRLSALSAPRKWRRSSCPRRRDA